MPRHNLLSNSEMTDMIAVYCQIQFNGGAAARRYRELYRNRRQPNRKLFQILFQLQKECGTFRVKHCAGRPTARIAVEEEGVLERVAENPNISVRRLSTATGVSRTSIHNIFRTQLLYLYHHTKVQELLPNNLPRRFNFCRWFRNKKNNDPTFFGRVLFTDEATFTHRWHL